MWRRDVFQPWRFDFGRVSAGSPEHVRAARAAGVRPDSNGGNKGHTVAQHRPATLRHRRCRPRRLVHTAAPPKPLAHLTRRRPRITDWNPEDQQFWESTGARIARRNMICSVFTEHIGFAVWTMWSTLILFLGPQYGLTPDQ